MSSDSSRDGAPKLTAGRTLLWGATLPLAGLLSLLAMGGVGAPWTIVSSVALALICAIGDFILRRRNAQRDWRALEGGPAQISFDEGDIDHE